MNEIFGGKSKTLGALGGIVGGKQLGEDLGQIRTAFAQWSPPGTRRDPLTIGPLKLELPKSLLDWMASRKDIESAEFKIGEKGVQLFQIVMNKATPHEWVELSGKAQRPAGVPQGQGFDVLLQNLSDPNQPAIKTRAAPDGSYNAKVPGHPGDRFTVRAEAGGPSQPVMPEWGELQVRKS